MKAEEPHAIGEAALAEMEALFDRWHRYRRGEIDRAKLQEEMRPVQERCEAVLKRAQGSGHWKAAPLGWHLWRPRSASAVRSARCIYPCPGERGSQSSNRLPSGSVAQPNRP